VSAWMKRTLSQTVHSPAVAPKQTSIANAMHDYGMKRQSSEEQEDAFMQAARLTYQRLTWRSF